MHWRALVEILRNFLNFLLTANVPGIIDIALAASLPKLRVPQILARYKPQVRVIIGPT